MRNIETLIKNYLFRCQKIVKSYPTNIHALDSINIISCNNSVFQTFLKGVESTLEFESFADKIDKDILNKDIERLIQTNKTKNKNSIKVLGGILFLNMLLIAFS